MSLRCKLGFHDWECINNDGPINGYQPPFIWDCTRCDLRKRGIVGKQSILPFVNYHYERRD